jgi:4-hydroxy-L-threonine phosphate dehydrogenase PdxA
LAGRVSAAAGRAAFEAIECGIRMALRGEVSALCTAPIDEEALAAAGVPYPGPTEMLTELSDSADTDSTRP